MAQTIPSGPQTSTFAVTSADTYILPTGQTRTYTGTGTALTASVTGTAAVTTIDIEGTLLGSQGNRTLNTTLALGQVTVGAGGLVQSLNNDAFRSQSVNGTTNLTNLGQIVAGSSAYTPRAGGTNPGTGYAVTYNAALGASGAPATDFTSGGTLTNGSASNTTALIQSNTGDAVRLGSHQTLVNYGTINGNGPVNDSSANNVFNGANGNPNVSGAETYDASRGVRLNQNNGTGVRIENHGTIQGAQHGVDVGQATVTGLVVTNHAGATILGRNGSGIGADTTGAAVDTIVVNNSGTIRGQYAPAYDRAGYATVDGDGDGVDVDGAATVNNFAGGLIAGAPATGLAGQGAGGFDANGRANRSEGLSLGGGVVLNAGTISGADSAIVVNNDANANGSRSGVLATSIVNGATGVIVGQAGYAIRLENKTGTAATDDDTIVNAGAITGNGGIPTGTVLRQDGNADPGTVGTLNGVAYTAANAGAARFIQGDGAAIQTGEGSDALANYGTITGNTGRAISLEGGNDTLTLYTGSTVTGRIDGGAGTDTLILRLDDRTGATNLGANGGATAGTLADVVGFEVLNVLGGTWTVSDAQGYASGIAVAAGAGLVVGASGSIAGAVANAGVLRFAHAGDLAQAGAISGTGSVVQAGSGALVLSAASTYSGGTTLVSGTLDLAAATTGGFGAVTSAAAGTGAIRFTDGAQTLRIEAAALGADGGFSNAIAGFAADGDVIDLRGIGQTSSAAFDYAGNILTLADSAGTHATLHLTGSYAGALFSAASDGAGGTQVTLSRPTLAVTATLARDTGASGTDGVTADPTVTGTADAGARVTFSEGGTVLGSVTADAQGRYAFGFRDGSGALLADGAHAIAVTETALGATVAAAQPVRFVLDTTPPTLRADAASGTGVAAALTGTLLANDGDASGLHLAAVQFGNRAAVAVPASGTVQVVGDHGLLSVGADGSYRYQPTSPGHETFAETVLDAAGNAARTTLTLDVARAAIPASLSFGFALTDAHFDFSHGHDLMTAPDGTVTDLTGVATIAFADGTVQERDGAPLVDDLYYAATNLDVWRAHVDPDQHYAQFGWREGRDPDAYFSTRGYLAANPDVARAGIDPLRHYDEHGRFEGRSPGPNFSAEAYLAANPDVAAAGIDPLAHYLANGQAEGRAAFPGLTVAQATGHHLYGAFDATYYLATYADVAAAARTQAGSADSFAFRHYLAHGAQEGRDPDASFSTSGYLAANPDVAAAGQNPLLHYEVSGWHEGRDPGPAFHVDAYLAANPDVAAAQVDPLAHYLQFGIGEGRHLA